MEDRGLGLYVELPGIDQRTAVIAPRGFRRFAE
jgi:hypothetical protein